MLIRKLSVEINVALQRISLSSSQWDLEDVPHKSVPRWFCASATRWKTFSSQVEIYNKTVVISMNITDSKTESAQWRHQSFPMDLQCFLRDAPGVTEHWWETLDLWRVQHEWESHMIMLPNCKGSFAVADPSRCELLRALCQSSYLLMRRMVNRAPDTEKAMAADRVEMPGQVYLKWKHKLEKMMSSKVR